jgi:hypothetical protein
MPKSVAHDVEEILSRLCILAKKGRGASAKKAGFPIIAHLAWQKAEARKYLFYPYPLGNGKAVLTSAF